MKRREARERSFHFLYQVQIQETDITEQLHFFLNLCREEGFDEEDLTYIRETIEAVLQKQEELDSKIQQYLRRWTIDRLPKVERAILRLAIYEIETSQAPFSVICNEAVLLAKAYGTEEASRYINGLLARLDPDRSGEEV